MTQDILITPGSGEPQILFRGSGTNDTPIELNVLSSYQSATGSGTALVFEGQEGQLFAVTDNLSSGTIFSVGDITGLSMLSVDASGDVKLGEFANSVIVYPGLTLDDNVPSTTSNVLYNDGGDLMWNGVTVIQSGAAQAVDGSGTAGQVAFFSDTNTIASESNLYWDSSNNRLGIGTSSPARDLDIVNAGNSVLRIASTSSNQDASIILENTAQGWTIQNDGNASLGTANYFHIRDITANSSRLVIDTNGNVGIGTTSPSQTVDIRYPASGGMVLLKSTDTNDGLLFGDVYSANNAFQGVKHAAMTGTNDYMMISDGNSTLISSKSTGYVYVATGGNNSNSLLTMKSSEVVINDNGSSNDFRVESNNDANALFVDGVADNVGIGTASPSEKLHVAGDVLIDGDGTTIGGGSWDNGWLKIGTSSVGIAIDSNEIYGSNNLHLGTLDTASIITFRHGITERIRIASGGNVGIGTTSPSEKLHVIGEGLFLSEGTKTSKIVGTDSSLEVENALSIFRGTSNFGWLITSDSNNWFGIYNWNRNGYVFRIDDNTVVNAFNIKNNGSIGIGTTYPSQKLHIDEGNIRIEKTTDPTIEFNNGSANRASMFYDTSEETFVLNHTDADANQLVLTSGNNVGIGTNDPNATLHVYSATSGENVFNVEGTNGSLFGVTDNLSGVLMSVNTIAGLPVLEVNSDYSLTAGRFNQNDFAISSSGNVGIGTASPSQKLHVAGNLRLTGAFYDSNNAAGTSGQVLSSTATGTDWISLSEIQGVDGTGSAGQVAFWSDADTITGESNLYWDSSNDRLGIGTTSPLTPLHVKDGGSGSDGIRIDYGPSNTYNLRLDGVGGIRQWRGTGSNGGMTLTTSLTSGSWGGDQGGLIAFQPRDTEAARFDGLGNFGIGTASPTHKLHIKGAVDSSTGSYSQLMIESEATTYPDTIAGIALNSVASHQSHIRFLNNGAAKFQIRYNTANTTEDKLKIFSFTQSADMVTFDGATGRVGIGTTGPSGSLHLEKSTVGGNNVYFRNTNNGSGSYQSLRLGNDTALTKFIIFTNSSTRTADGGAGNTTIRTDSGDLILGSSGNERIRITSGGNVGIGTTLPDRALHLYSSASTDFGLQVESTAGNSSIRVVANTTTKVPSVDFYDTSTRFGRIGIDRTSNIITGLSKNDMFVTTSQSSNKLHLATNSISRVTVDTDGNVGIGTTSPNAVLHAYGSTPSGTVFNVEGTNGSLFSVVDNLSGVLMSVNNNAGLPVFEVNDDDSIIAGRFAQDDFVITSSGDIGMGTANPSSKLEVNGTVTATSFSGAGTGLTGTAASLTAGAVTNGVYTTGNQTVGGVKTFSSQIISTAANSTSTGGGQIYLNGATGNRIDFAGVGYNVPTFTTRSVGTKIVLYPALGASSVDYAIGIEASTLWSSIPGTAYQFKWYAGTTSVADLTGAGVLTVAGSTSQINVDNLRLDGNTLSSTNTNGNVIITPNGTGGIAGGTAATVTGNYATVGGGCSNTASGNFSTVSGGYPNTASGAYSTVGGGGGVFGSNIASGNFSTVSGGGGVLYGGNTASGAYSTVGGGGGGAIFGGSPNTASGNFSTVSGGKSNCACACVSTVVGGYQAKASRYGEVAHAAGQFAQKGDAQHSTFVARKNTTNATANVELFLDGSAQRMTLTAETTWTFDIKLSAYNDTDNTTAWWIIRGGIRRNAANGTTLIGSLIEERDYEGTMSGTSAAVTADDTNESLKIAVTGLASKNIRWVAVVDVAQVSWGTP
jgi:hypothetical protein